LRRRSLLIKVTYVKKYNIGTAILLICVGIYVIHYSGGFDPIVNGTPGPGFWPRILGVLLIFVSTLLAVTTIFTRKQLADHLIDFKAKGFRQVVKLFAVMILFGVGLNFIGFLPSSLLFVVLVMWIMGVRSIPKICIASFAITISIYVIFAVALGLVLPKGKLFY